jgi:hypothetical protein
MRWNDEIAHLVSPLRDISIEELQEQADEVDYLTPREFGKLIAVKPQQVYQWIRKGVLSAERCQCGRTVLCVSRAKATLEARSISRGQKLDSRSDGPGIQGFGSDVHDSMSQED